MYHKITGNDDDQSKKKPDIMIRNHFFSFMNKIHIGHISGKMSQISSDPGKDDIPDPRSQNCKKYEWTVFHFCKTGRNGNDLTDPGQQTADECGDFSVFPEDFFGPLKRIRFQKEILL